MSAAHNPKGAVFATCPHCGWHVHHLPALPAIGFTPVLLRCDRGACGRYYIVLTEFRRLPEGTHRLRLLGERKLFFRRSSGIDPTDIRRALESFGHLNADELAMAEASMLAWIREAQAWLPRAS